MAEILKDSKTEILAASLKSPEEAAATLAAGAHHLTIPLSILQAMTTHELSNDTVAEFAAKGTGSSLKLPQHLNYCFCQRLKYLINRVSRLSRSSINA